MQQRVHECHMNSVDVLKQRLVWHSQQQSVTAAAIDQYSETESVHACRIADEHFEHLL